ncbi:GMC oxidoreductase [Actinomyces glycerinitolerans]|uniref:Gmc oxidoreductase n=1 Tax=Actinomyces glycerinitolerans TaxID=1892869 RepID=A0A1M4RYK8_9ACTO|nr:GMC family oxidoreductase [Actinomyces glycerinitolerans]SHE24990.1 gmc oxidoreductase [Actinomyces glycerinitolerans]
MSNLHQAQDSPNIDRHFDAVVIGSGPAGSTAVRELTAAGMDVLLLEAGRELTEEDFTPPVYGKPKPMGMDIMTRAKRMLGSRQFNQARRSFYSDSSSRFLVDDLANPYTYPLDAPYLWVRSRLLGGRMHAYGRVLQRMSDVDFKAASLDGVGIDWPFEYADLAPYYDRVEELVGVYGDADPGVEHPPAGRYVGPGHLNEMEQEFKRVVESRWPDRHVISWRFQAPFLDRVPPGIREARKTGRLTIRTNAVVSRITTNARTGLATGAVFIDARTKREHRVTGDVVMLCASAIESVRLLLNSGSSRHPGGLANSNGLVGHYLMEQSMTLGFGDDARRPGYFGPSSQCEEDPFYGNSGGFLIPRYQNLNGQTEAYKRGYSFQGLAGRVPVPEDSPAMFGFGAGGEMLPQYGNHVALSRHVKDKWGIPAAHIVCRPDDNDRTMVAAAVRDVTEMMQAGGYRTNFVASTFGVHSKHVWPDFNPAQRAMFRVGIRMSLMMGVSIHEAGGARMGHDPATSVLNGVAQSWDVPNLFVTDAASFPTGSTEGPALTIMAVTARACDYITRAHAAGELTRPTQDVVL